MLSSGMIIIDAHTAIFFFARFDLTLNSLDFYFYLFIYFLPTCLLHIYIYVHRVIERSLKLEI